MKTKISLVLTLLALLLSLVLVSCQDNTQLSSTNSLESSAVQMETVTDEQNSAENLEVYTDKVETQVDQLNVRESAEEYTIYDVSEGLYRHRIDFIDTDGNVVESKYIRNEPHMLETTYNGTKIIGFWAGEGTGISARVAVFFDPKKGKCSDTFTYYLDLYENKVLTGITEGVIVQDIFDSSVYHKEITSFEGEVAQNVLDAVNAEFSEDGTAVIVTYKNGDLETKTETINID